MRQYVGALTLALVIGSQCIAQNSLVNIQDITPEEVKMAGFRLSAEQAIKIEAVGYRSSRKYDLEFTRAWILNSRTRDVIWEMKDADIKDEGRKIIEYADELTLPKGDYEVYFSSVPDYYNYKHEGGFFERIFDQIFDHNDYEDVYYDYREEWKKFRITVRGNGQSISENRMEQLQTDFKENAFVSMTRLGDDEHRSQGFTLERPTDIRIYALGEARKDGTFDYGWIMNTETREKVWQLTLRDSRHAGGAKKNRLVDEVISLPAGKYAAFFVTDDSHSFRQWNLAPPYDPMFWGLTLKVENPAMRKYVHIYNFEDMPEENVIVKLTKVRDDEFLSKGFTCKRDLDIRIYALGEGKRHEMFDYGWIVDAGSHKRVWEMEYDNTEHAGGAIKNRLFNGVRNFKKGNYIVYYVSDDSHSYWEWNDAPPYDQENWGITLLAADKNFKPEYVSDYEERQDQNILAQLVRMRDDEREQQRFTLDKDAEVRIYAIGEGRDGEMFDYGWIEDAHNRQIVWEMTYRKTDYAGGGSKNRLFDGTILLKKGDYILRYESDDSHSFNDWNDAPPYDPMHWGITVYLVKD